ncbi:hypothetical protein CSHISOI_11248, partial [Colletotrichum shisoi]
MTMIKSNIIFTMLSFSVFLLQGVSSCRQAIATYSKNYECNLDKFECAIYPE